MVFPQDYSGNLPSTQQKSTQKNGGQRLTSSTHWRLDEQTLQQNDAYYDRSQSTELHAANVIKDERNHDRDADPQYNDEEARAARARRACDAQGGLTEEFLGCLHRNESSASPMERFGTVDGFNDPNVAYARTRMREASIGFGDPGSHRVRSLGARKAARQVKPHTESRYGREVQ
ncbi:MAG: hypothetical protein M1837_000166 [Sclerophora amabilis]|nr:MAG: hypothetical protein M1837_000166 [Sclerophora amabilis]